MTCNMHQYPDDNWLCFISSSNKTVESAVCAVVVGACLPIANATLLSMSFIVICTWRLSMIFVKSNFSRRNTCNCHLINSLTLHSLRTLPWDRPRLRSSCWRMLTNCNCYFFIHVIYCDLHLEVVTDLCEK